MHFRRQSVQAAIIPGHLGHLPHRPRNIFSVKVFRKNIDRRNHETRAAQFRVSQRTSRRLDPRFSLYDGNGRNFAHPLTKGPRANI
jgi:hypothetical protein